MNRLIKALTFATFLAPSLNANAGFPDDLSDVVFTEASQVKNWTVGADMNLTIAGGSIILDHSPNENSSATGIWPTIRIFNTAVNANAWGIVKENGVWRAGTWEYLRTGQTVKRLEAFRKGHFRHIGTVPLQDGDLYGFFVSGTIRAGASLNNIPERSKFVVYEWGKGVIFTEGDITVVEEPALPLIPLLDLLLEDDTPSPDDTPASDDSPSF